MRKVNILAAVCLFSVAAMAQQSVLGIRQLDAAEAARIRSAAFRQEAPQALLGNAAPCLSAPLEAKVPQARAEALAEGEQYVGYFSNETDLMGMGFEADRITAATFYDAGICQKYAGDRVTRLSAMLGTSVSGCTLWIAESLEGPRAAEAEIPAESLPSADGGTVEAVLDAPFTIPAEGFYIGYDLEFLPEAERPAQYYPALVNIDGMMGSGTAFFSTDGSAFDDLTSYYASSYGYVFVLGMQACVESERHSARDLALLDFESMAYLFDRSHCNDEGQYPVTIIGSVLNYGIESVESFTLAVSCNGQPYSEIPFTSESAIRPFGGARFATQIPVEDTANMATFTFEVAAVGSGQDEYADNDEAALPLMMFYSPEQAAAKTPLLELYTTGQCPNCPYGHAAVSAAATTSHPAIVAHHVGFYTDEFTIGESNVYMNAFGVGGAPSAVADRAWNSYNGAYAFSTGYTDAAAGGEVINQYLSEAGALIPAFATITAVPSYDADTRRLTVAVSGTKSDAALFDYVMAAPRVHAYLTEDGLVGDQIRPGGFFGSYIDTDYVHDHVLRAILGEDTEWGVVPEWNGDTYTATFTATLDPEWVPENMNIVVFISNESGEGPWHHAVMNAAQVNLSGEDTGIDAASASDTFAVWGGEGRVCLSGEYRSFRVYTLQGAEVPAAGLAPGIYVVAVDTESGTQVRKVAVR